MVNLYYQSDRDVQEDLELQAWIRDISLEGFTELPNFGQLLISCIFILINTQVLHMYFQHSIFKTILEVLWSF